MRFPSTYRLRRPRYIFSEDGTKSHFDRHRGLLALSPLKPAPISEPTVAFVFLEDDREHGNQLYLALRNGIGSFPGCRQLTGVRLERKNVEAIRVDTVRDEPIGLAFHRAIRARLDRAPAPDFVFVVYSKQAGAGLDDPYPAAKAALARHGVPSQYVSWELLNSKQQFRYAISNVALSFFVKLGGVPWSVALNRKKPTLVFGIGRATTSSEAGERRRLTGFATSVLSNGVYLYTSFFPPAESEDQFLEALGEGVVAALGQALESHSAVEKLTVHVSQFERRQVATVLDEAVAGYARTHDLPIPFEIVRVTEDSDFTVLDLRDPGFVSEEGTVVNLGPAHSLLVTEGRRERDVWRGRKPVTLELRREYGSSASLQMKETIEDAFALSTVNWRGFNAVTQPITLLYARLLAELVGKMSLFEPEIASVLGRQDRLNAVPWFI